MIVGVKNQLIEFSLQFNKTKVVIVSFLYRVYTKLLLIFEL